MNVSFLSFEKHLGCFWNMLWIIIHLHCEALCDQFCSFCLNLSRKCDLVAMSQFILLLRSAVTIKLVALVHHTFLFLSLTNCFPHFWFGLSWNFCYFPYRFIFFQPKHVLNFIRKYWGNRVHLTRKCLSVNYPVIYEPIPL